jgi:hypothetical protein
VLTTALRGVAPIVTSTVAAVVLGLLAVPAWAQEEGPGNEGDGTSLRQQFSRAAEKYQDARSILDESEERELALVVRLDDLEAERDTLIGQIQLSASTAYRTGRVGPITALLNASSSNAFLARLVAVDMLTTREDEQLARFRDLGQELETQRTALAEEIALQEEEVQRLEEAKDEAEAALFAIGGGTTGTFEAFPSEDAAPFTGPDDGCTEDDPTTAGCVSKRMLHSYNEAQVFGFTRYTSMWRDGGGGEHPLGRAGDFACSPNGFGGEATGGDKTYCDRLASFFVHNADALGVIYVIWFREIWFTGSGWSTYGGCAGDPASCHTNHVHLSVRG